MVSDPHVIRETLLRASPLSSPPPRALFGDVLQQSVRQQVRSETPRLASDFRQNTLKKTVNAGVCDLIEPDPFVRHKRRNKAKTPTGTATSAATNGRRTARALRRISSAPKSAKA